MHPDISPNTPVDKQPVIGLIGMGAMGRMYARHLSAAGWKRFVVALHHIFPLNRPRRIHVCDQPSNYLTLKHEYDGE
jgi:prephenate dehydrogenase (NADP+)